MKTTALVFAVVTSLGFNTLALAQDHNRRGQSDEFPQVQQQTPRQTGQRGPQRYDNRVEQRGPMSYERQAGQRADQRVDQRADRRADRGQDRRYEQRFDQRAERWNDRSAYYNARGPEFRRGGYIPREYRNPTYVISDYRSHRLPPPPRHQEWVQVGSDYVLIAIATGIIASIVLSQ